MKVEEMMQKITNFFLNKYIVKEEGLKSRVFQEMNNNLAISAFASAPDDIIRRILYICCNDLRYYNSLRPKSFWKQERILLSLTHICRRWRLVALDMPILWSYLLLPAYGPEQVAKYLERSRIAPLTVYMDVVVSRIDTHDRSLSQRIKLYFSLIDKHAERIEKLCMIGNEDFFAENVLSSFLNRTTNVLDLTVGHGRVPSNRWLPGGNIAFPLSADRFPKLRKLHVMPMILPTVPISTRMEKLTHLAITDDEINLANLTVLLNSCRSLISLRILEISNENPTSEANGQIHSVCLPLLSELHLGYLHLADNLSTAYILRGLDLPQLAFFDFTLSHNWGKVNIVNDSLIPTNIPQMKHCQSIIFRISKTFSLEAIGTLEDKKGVREYAFRYSIADYSSYGVAINRFAAMKDIYFPGIIHFELDLTEGGQIISDSWINLLDSLPMLESIKFRVRGENNNQVEGRPLLIKILSACYSASSDNAKWPLLRFIELDGFHFGGANRGSTVPTLITMLTSRNNAGYRLPELRVPNAKFLHPAILIKLKALVGKLIVS